MFAKEKQKENFGTLDIFNRGEHLADGMDIEFAECRECGQIYDRRNAAGQYPHRCVRCGAEFVSINLVGVRGDEAKRPEEEAER